MSHDKALYKSTYTLLYFTVASIGVSLAGILGVAEADPEGLVGGEEWGSPKGRGIRRRLGPCLEN